MQKRKDGKSGRTDVLEERMTALDPANNECYKFLKYEQNDKILTNKVLVRAKKEITKRVKNLVELNLYDKHLIKAINTTAIPVAAYVKNICNLAEGDLDGLDKLVKEILREKLMHGRQDSDERLYLIKENGGRGLKSFKDVYRETKVRVACYMANSNTKWIRKVWRREVNKEGITIKSEVEKQLRTVGNIKLCKDGVKKK